MESLGKCLCVGGPMTLLQLVARIIFTCCLEGINNLKSQLGFHPLATSENWWKGKTLVSVFKGLSVAKVAVP
jgi:hypothetical protein